MSYRPPPLALLLTLLAGGGLNACTSDDSSAMTGSSATAADTAGACDGSAALCDTSPSAAQSAAPTASLTPAAGSSSAHEPEVGPTASETSSTAPSTPGSGTSPSTEQTSASSDPSTGTGGMPSTTGGAGGEATVGSGATGNGGVAGEAQGGESTGGVSAQGGAAGAPSLGGSGGQVTAPDRDARRLLLRDEGIAQLSYVDLAAPAENWHVPVPLGRDMQLVGAGRVMIGTENGYEERAIGDGSQVAALTTYAGTLAAQRLRSGNTLLVGLNWQGQTGIVLVEVEPQGGVARTINFPDFDYVRLVRPTATGTFLVTADNVVFEGDDAGNIVWQVTLSGQAEPHAWKALRLASGNTVIATGYNASLQIFSPDEQLLDTITGPAEANPFFFCDFQLLASGNFLVTNWQGHGADLGGSGTQVIEYAPSGEVAWSWQQDPSYVSSLQAVIALDGLDLERLHVEDTTGELVAVP